MEDGARGEEPNPLREPPTNGGFPSTFITAEDYGTPTHTTDARGGTRGALSARGLAANPAQNWPARAARTMYNGEGGVRAIELEDRRGHIRLVGGDDRSGRFVGGGVHGAAGGL